jgi:hypothetical protein
MNELADGDSDFLIDLYQEIINQFVEARDGYIAQLNVQDTESLRKIAHKVSPNLQSLDIDGIPEIFAKVRDQLLNGITLSNDQVKEYQEKLQVGFDFCIAQLKTEIEQLQ